MTTFAVGRHLVDLPVGFATDERSLIKLYFGLSSDFKLVEVEILDGQATPASYAAAVEKRIAELASRQHRKLDRPMLIEHSEGPGPGRHLIRSYKDLLRTVSYKSEIYVLAGTSLLSATADSYGTDPLDAEDRLRAVASRISFESLPSGRGVCMGPVRIDSSHDEEVVSLSFSNPRIPHAKFTFFADALVENPKQSLLQQWDKESDAITRWIAKPYKTLGRGTARLAGMPAEQLLLETTDKGRKLFKFDIESMRADPSFARPYMHIGLDTDPADESVSLPASAWNEQQALDIWSAVVESVRLRPGSVG